MEDVGRHGLCLFEYLAGAELPLGEDAVADHLQGGGGAAGDARGAAEEGLGGRHRQVVVVLRPARCAVDDMKGT